MRISHFAGRESKFPKLKKKRRRKNVRFHNFSKKFEYFRKCIFRSYFGIFATVAAMIKAEAAYMNMLLQSYLYSMSSFKHINITFRRERIGV